MIRKLEPSDNKNESESENENQNEAECKLRIDAITNERFLNNVKPGVSVALHRVNASRMDSRMPKVRVYACMCMHTVHVQCQSVLSVFGRDVMDARRSHQRGRTSKTVRDAVLRAYLQQTRQHKRDELGGHIRDSHL